MKAAGPRRRRTLALLTSCIVASLALMAPAGARSNAQPIDCVLNPDAPDCSSTTSETFEETTSTEELPPATSADTPTTDSATATSVDQPVTTAEIDDASDLTTTTLSVTTSSNLLVPGDGTEGAEATTTSTTVAASVDDGGTSDGTLIALVIGGLVAVALLVAFLTWRYWVATRPPPLPDA